MKRQNRIVASLIILFVVSVGVSGVEVFGDVLNYTGPIAVQVSDSASLVDLNLAATGDVYWFIGEQGELSGESFEFICHDGFICESTIICDSITVELVSSDIGGGGAIDITIDPPNSDSGDVTVFATAGNVDYYGGSGGDVDIGFGDVHIGGFSNYPIICASSCQMPEVVGGIDLDPWPHGLVGLAVVDGTEAVVVDGDVLLWIDQGIGDVYIEADGMIQILNGDVPVGLFTVPEPGSMVLLIGGLCLGWMRRRGG